MRVAKATLFCYSTKIISFQMKRLISSLLAVGILSPVSVSAQQLNTYQVCYTYQEQYAPGYYAPNGSYVQGGVYTVKNTVNCQTGEVYSSQPYKSSYNYVPYQPYRTQRICNPSAGAALGAGLASALSGGGGWNNSGSWSRNYNRNGSSGSWSSSYRNTSGWTLFGAGLGALMYSC
jgi:hypothetical protein